MIHDIILSLIAEKESRIIQELLTEDLSSKYVHPAEIKILRDIVKITSYFREIKEFVSSYGKTDSQLIGFYLRQFANGIDSVLETYYGAVIQLEKKFLRKPTTSLMFIFHEIDKFRPVFEFLIKLINGVKTQKLHGCQILEYLEDNSMHGNNTILDAVAIIQKSVYSIFIQQLYQWLNGKLYDIHDEFFIVHTDDSSEKQRPQYSTQTSVQTFQSSEQSINVELWQYDINFEMLPHYFTRSWAEKVLFIGRTVLTLNCESNTVKDVNLIESELYYDDSAYEKQLFQKFHQLQKPNKLTVLTFEQIIDDVKLSVTELLSNLAIKDADLMKQLKLFKEFYLLGRGELFYEFIKGLNPIFGIEVTENTIRDINRIFHVAAVGVSVQDDAELFQFEINKIDTDSFSYDSKGLFQFISLQYKIKSPLHLIFSPKVLSKYNELFRFLIRIRKIQYDLQILWCHHREKKLQRNSELVQFRNKLMFLTDNLLYYLHVDVLESQFSIMMEKIGETRDFEKIIRAHNFFQANVLSLCFHLETIDVMAKSIQNSIVVENPVLMILNKIFNLSEQFTAFAYVCSSPMNDEDKVTFCNFEDLFVSLVDALFKMLSSNTSAVAITQLLLRLDFNYWFSTKNIVKT